MNAIKVLLSSRFFLTDRLRQQTDYSVNYVVLTSDNLKICKNLPIEFRTNKWHLFFTSTKRIKMNIPLKEIVLCHTSVVSDY